MLQSGKVAQLEGIVARNVVGRTDGGEHFRLFDRVDAEIGLEIQVRIQHVRRIACLLGDDRHHLVLHRIETGPAD